MLNRKLTGAIILLALFGLVTGCSGPDSDNNAANSQTANASTNSATNNAQNGASDNQSTNNGVPNNTTTNNAVPNAATNSMVPMGCESAGGNEPVREPQLVRNISGQTSWFASPVVIDIDGDGSRELVAAYYDLFVYNADLELAATGEAGEGRVYAPHVVADLDGDGTMEIVVGRGSEVIAYDWTASGLEVREGFPVDTTTAGNPPEVRGLAAGDLDRNGTLEIVATTTQTEPTANGGAQVFVFTHAGESFQPTGGHSPAWPRYNTLGGPGNDSDRNGMGHDGFGCYGLNVGLGNIDDDIQLEVLVTYDNHHIQAFEHDGVAIDASPWFRNRAPEFLDERMTWGQLIRWADPRVEENHYHDHVGEWPHPSFEEWLQWTASPPNVVDIDGDGLNEVVAIPNIEKNEPYQTQAYAVMVLEGNHGDESRSAMRKEGWEVLPRGGDPTEVEGGYPPLGIPAPTTVDIDGDGTPEIIVPMNDGRIRAFDANAQELWNYDFTHGRSVMYASEVMVADLNRDGSPELLFTTYGAPDEESGYLVALSAQGQEVFDLALPEPGMNGNGNGAPAAPAVGDLDGDGQLEIFVQTFDHGMDVFTVPGSAENCLLWTTARGSSLRQGNNQVR